MCSSQLVAPSDAPSSQPSIHVCDEGITADQYPQDISWELINACNGAFIDGDKEPISGPFQKYSETTCLKAGT